MFEQIKDLFLEFKMEIMKHSNGFSQACIFLDIIVRLNFSAHDIVLPFFI